MNDTTKNGAPPANGNTIAFTDLDKILERQDDSAAAQMIDLLPQGPITERDLLNRLRGSVILAPKNLHRIDLASVIDGLRTQPDRREGTHTVHTLDSFNDLTIRFKAGNSVIFADSYKSTLTAVLDFHPQGEDNADARFGKHRVFYDLPFSKEWQAWIAQNGKVMEQAEFAEFIEDRIAEVAMPGGNLLGTISDAATGGDFGDKSPVEQMAYLAKTLGGHFALPSELVTLSKGLAIREGLQFRQAENINTGEQTIVFESELQDGSGAPLRVPNLFLIALPIYHGGQPYALAVRLRFRRNGKNLVWVYQMYRVEQALDHAFDEAVASAIKVTGLPLYRGAIS